MKILVVSPLFPPDIGETASYTKEAARRLSERHSVSVLAYGRLLEQIPGVRFIEVDKRQPLIVRIVQYTWALLQAVGSVDIIYAQNGPSVELPLGIALRIRNTPLVMHIADEAAHRRAERSRLFRLIERFCCTKAAGVIDEMPPQRPEIIPFQPFPREATESYETSWQNHIDKLETTFAHARHK